MHRRYTIKMYQIFKVYVLLCATVTTVKVTLGYFFPSSIHQCALCHRIASFGKKLCAVIMHFILVSSVSHILFFHFRLSFVGILLLLRWAMHSILPLIFFLSVTHSSHTTQFFCFRRYACTVAVVAYSLHLFCVSVCVTSVSRLVNAWTMIWHALH